MKKNFSLKFFRFFSFLSLVQVILVKEEKDTLLCFGVSLYHIILTQNKTDITDL